MGVCLELVDGNDTCMCVSASVRKKMQFSLIRRTFCTRAKGIETRHALFIIETNTTV